MSPSLLTRLQRAGEEVGTGPDGGSCYGGEISIYSIFQCHGASSPYYGRWAASASQEVLGKMQNQHFQGTIQMSSSHVSTLFISHQIPNFGIIDRPFWAFICLWSSVTLTIRSSVCSLPTSIFPLKDIQPSLRATKKVLWLLHSAINCFLTVFGLPISFSRALIQFGSS